MRKFNNAKSKEVAEKLLKLVEETTIESRLDITFQSKTHLANELASIMSKLYAELLSTDHQNEQFVLISADLFVFFKDVKKHLSLDETLQ
jgi:hypothetical protein